MSSRLPDRRVFVDTSAYYAAADRRDAQNRAMIATMRTLVRDGLQLVTSNFIIAETHALTQSRLGAATALAVIRSLQTSQIIIRVDVPDEMRGIEILTRYTDKEFSFVDAMSFAVMERLGIQIALSLDNHFRQYGWQTVPLSDA